MAAKEKQIFFCKECGYESAKWQGQCPGCRAWNTFVEEKVKVGVKGAVKQPKDAVSPMGIFAGDNGGGKPHADRYAGT